MERAPLQPLFTVPILGKLFALEGVSVEAERVSPGRLEHWDRLG